MNDFFMGLWKLTAKICNDCLTGPDNHTFDIARVFCALSFGVLYSKAFSPNVSLMDFASAAAAIAMAFAGMIRLKNGAEPQGRDL